MSILGKIKDDFSNLPDILDEYDKFVESGKDRLIIKGRNLSECIVDQATYYAYYDEKRAELKTLLNFFENAIKVKRGMLYNKITNTSKIAHSDRGKDKMIDSSDELTILNELFLDVSESYMKMDSIVKGFEQRAFSLNNLVKIYDKNLEDVVVSSW